jgi:hypothetical protein
MSYLERIFETAREQVTIPNPLIFTGAVRMSGSGGLFNIGVFASAVQGSGIPLARSGTNSAAHRIYADDAGAVLWGSGSVPDIRGTLSRVLLTKNNTGGNIRVFGLMGQVKAYDAYWNGEQVGAVHGRLEIVRSAATLTLGGYGISAAGAFTVETSGAVTNNTNHVLAGVAAISDFKATLTQTGVVPAFLAAKYDTTNWSDATARGTTWTHALYVKSAGYALGFLSGTSYEAGVKVASVTAGVTAGGTVLTFDAVMKIDIAGTAYYVGAFAAGNLGGE